MLAAWLCVALALGLVFWWRTDGEKKAEVAAEGNSPRVTKSYPRERVATERRTKSSREEFEAARKRGLTEAEVRGVVEEFIAMNLNPKSPDKTADPEDAREEWKRREQWYLDTLVSGFGLTGQQKKQAAARLRELGERDFKNYQEFLANRMSPAKKPESGGKLPFWLLMEILGPDGWFQYHACAPWNLCDLDEEQKKMIGYSDGEGQWGSISGGKMTKDFGTDERYENLDDQQTSQNGFINPAGRFFPLSMDQVDRIRSANVIHVDHLNRGDRTIKIDPRITLVSRLGILPYAKFLSGPQLRTYLLFRPDMAENLMKELGE